jgi:hypothetical protein
VRAWAALESCCASKIYKRALISNKQQASEQLQVELLHVGGNSANIRALWWSLNGTVSLCDAAVEGADVLEPPISLLGKLIFVSAY